MCRKAMYHKDRVGMGSHMIYTGANNRIYAGRWGMFQSSASPQLNVRFDSLNTTWKSYIHNRGVLELDGFFERGFYFHGKEGTTLRFPIIYDGNYDFAIITRSAKPVVAKVHERQPIIIDVGRENLWIEYEKLIEITDEVSLFMIKEQDLKKTA